MHEVGYRQLASVEDESWWFESRRRLVRSVLGKLELPSGAAGLDVGCGTGGSLALLSEFCAEVVGLDLSDHALKIAREKHPAARLISGDANELAEYFPADSLDLVTFLNVIYHDWIPDEGRALKQAWRVIKPGGVLLLTEPAFDCLYRRHDLVGMGKGRYTLKSIRRIVEGAGFKRVTETYFNSICFLPAWCIARMDRWRGSRQVDEELAEGAVPPGPINSTMKFAMTMERALIRLTGGVPFGVTLLHAARKPLAGDTNPARSRKARKVLEPCPA